MDNDNLIEFTSPSKSPYINHHQIPIITSSNPFDEPPINHDYRSTQFVSPSKINFEDFNCNFVRESIGRESLLIHSQSTNYGRESLGLIDLDDIDIGRPSLGIERLKITKKHSINNNNDSNDILNQALLYSTEDLNDTVFNSNNPSFNSNSLRNSLCSISSIKVTDLTTTNILNKRLYNSNDFYDRLKFTKFTHLNRISSLPESLPINENDEDLLTNKLWHSAIATVQSNYEDLDPILIEARHFADHIKNGSIFNEELDDIYTVEHTTQPNLVDNSFDNLEETPQKSCEITTNESNQQHSNSPIKGPRELLNSLSEMLNTNNQQQNTEGHNLLNSLANILLSKSNSPPSSIDDDITTNDNGNYNHHQRDDSGNSSIENLQQLNNEECYEILDLRLKISQDNSKSSTDDAPLDLSIKSKEHEFVQPTIVLSKSDNQKNSINQSRNLSLSQNDNNTSLNKYSFNNSNQMKFKKNDEKKRCGPLKAVIPIDNMMKTPVLYNPTTPTTEHKLKKTSTPIHEAKMKPMAQSTPDTPSNMNNKWKFSSLKSTSDQNLTTSIETKCHLNYSDSNLSSDQSKSLNKSNDNRKLRYSLNDDEKQQQQQQRPKTFQQRRSLSDLKRPQITKNEPQQLRIPRSYSAGKDPKILSSIKRVRQSINKNDKSKGSLYRSHSTDKEINNLEKTKFNVKNYGNDRVLLNENKNRVVLGKSLMVKRTIGKENVNR